LNISLFALILFGLAPHRSRLYCHGSNDLKGDRNISLNLSEEYMNNWKTIGQIASSFGIIFIAFAALAAFFEYETLSYLYGTVAPVGFIQFSVLNAMLPYLMLAVLSFIVAAASRRHTKEPLEERESGQTQLPLESQPEESVS